MSIIIHYDSLLNKTHNGNCDVFRAAALDTWSRIGFSRTRPLLKIHETTITQNIVYELNILKAANTAFTYQIYESTNEKANGNDLIISIRNSNGQYYTFAVQAKIIYHTLPYLSKGIKNVSDGLYPQIQHYVGANKNINQIDLLIAYAKRHRILPIYLLYNYVDLPLQVFSECNVNDDTRQFGCSIISAHYLKHSTYRLPDGNISDKIKYSDLHPHIALPWFVLACCFPTYTEQQILSELGITRRINFRPQEEDEVINENEWSELETFAAKEETAELRITGDIDNVKPEDLFIPKFKIVLQ